MAKMKSGSKSTALNLSSLLCGLNIIVKPSLYVKPQEGYCFCMCLHVTSIVFNILFNIMYIIYILFTLFLVHLLLFQPLLGANMLCVGLVAHLQM